MKEVTHQFAISQLYSVHDAIIQTLDRVLRYDEYGAPVMYPADVYEAALSSVNNAAIIYSPTGTHPDFYEYEINPSKAMSDVGAKSAGRILQPYVDRTGHPVTKGKLALEPDDAIESLIATGKLSLSPSVLAIYDEMGNMTNVRFQNLLIFPELPGGPVVPGDPGTIILNTQHTGTTMNEPQEVKPVIIDPALTAQIAEMAQQFTLFKTKLESNESETVNLKAQLATKDEELAAERATIAQFTAKVEQEKKDTTEREFQSMIHDPSFPVGLLAGENAETLLRDEFTYSPAQFTKKVMTVLVTQNKELEQKGTEQGQQFSAQTKEENEVYKKGKALFDKFELTEEAVLKVIC